MHGAVKRKLKEWDPSEFEKGRHGDVDAAESDVGQILDGIIGDY